MAKIENEAGRFLPLTPAVFQILLAVADAPRHGLGILEDVEQRSSGAVRMGPGTLYGSLQRMCAAGLLEASAQRPPVEHDDPRRRYYRVTELGRAAARLEAERLATLLELARAKRVYRGVRGATAGGRGR